MGDGKTIAVSSQGRGAGIFKENMVEVVAPRRDRYLQNNTTINPWRRGYIINNLLIWSDARVRTMSRIMPSFSSSFCVASTITTVTGDDKALAKDGLEKGAADGTAGPRMDSSTPSPRRTQEVAPLPPPRHQSSSMSLNDQRTSITSIDK